MTKNKRERKERVNATSFDWGVVGVSFTLRFLLSLGTPQWKGVFISSVCVKRGGYEIKMYICVEKKRERKRNKLCTIME